MDEVSRRTVLGAAGAIGIPRWVGAAPVVRASPLPDDVLLSDRSIPLAYSEAALNEAMMSGGVSEGGIPAIHRPSFVDAEDAPAQLDTDDPVIGAVLNGEAKAYPQYILVWHEIVNDRLGGEPIAMTYCPLTGTPQGFYRGRMVFTVSGMLVNSNLVMAQAGGDTMWAQMLAWGVNGDLSGYFLDEFRAVWTTWTKWKAQYPDTLVLTEDTGHVRNYGRDPYGRYNPAGGYYTGPDIMFQPMHTDRRFHPKAPMLGVRTEHGAIATKKARLREAGILETTIEGSNYVVVYDSRLDTGWFYRSDRAVAVAPEGAGYTVDGDGPYEPDEVPLEAVLTMDAMWFAWAAYFPRTTLLHEPDELPATRETGTGSETTPASDESGQRESTRDAGGSDALPGFGATAGVAGITAAWLAARKFGLLENQGE